MCYCNSRFWQISNNQKMHIKFLFFLDFQFRRWRHFCILFIQCTLGLSLEELGHYFVVPFLWDTVYRRARERRTKHTTTNLPFLFTKSSRFFSMKIQKSFDPDLDFNPFFMDFDPFVMGFESFLGNNGLKVAEYHSVRLQRKRLSFGNIFGRDFFHGNIMWS